MLCARSKVSALDYVLKPIAAARFERVLARVVERLAAAPAAYWRRLERLLDERTTVPATARAAATNGRILVPGAKRDIVVREDELEWVSADGCYATLHATGRAHLLRESLNALEVRLDPARFVRTHRSAIVNIEWVRELHRAADGGGTVVLASGAKAPVSRRRTGTGRCAIERRGRASLRRSAGDALTRGPRRTGNAADCGAEPAAGSVEPPLAS